MIFKIPFWPRRKKVKKSISSDIAEFFVYIVMTSVYKPSDNTFDKKDKATQKKFMCTYFNTSKKEALGKHCGKRWNCSKRAISPLSAMFSMQSVSKNPLIATFQLSFLWIWNSLKMVYQGIYLTSTNTWRFFFCRKMERLLTWFCFKARKLYRYLYDIYRVRQTWSSVTTSTLNAA